MYERDDVGMDLFELARTFQADREREIASTMRRRRLLAPTPPTRPGVDRDTRAEHAAASSGLGQSLSATRPAR